MLPSTSELAEVAGKLRFIVWVGAACIILALAAAPFAVYFERAVDEVSAISTYLYMMITAITLVVIIVAAQFARQQLTEITKSRRLSLIDTVFDLSRYYATREMLKAIITVWHSNPKEFDLDWEKKNDRRMVSEFWTMIAWAIKLQLVELDFFYERFGRTAMDIWDQRLRDLEVSERIKIEQENPHNAGKSADEIRSLAEHYVDRENVLGWLADEWKKKSGRKSDATRGELVGDVVD